MKNSILWLCWLVLPVFVLAFHYGPGQIWLARDQAATLISKAQAEAAVATTAQEAAYQAQLDLFAARRTAFAAGVDWETQVQHPLAESVIKATSEQDLAYKQAADVWHRTAGLYGEATDTLLKSIGKLASSDTEMQDADRNLLESLRWAQARAQVRSGEVFNGIEQLQALLDLRTAEANQQASSAIILTSTAAGQQASVPIDTARNVLPIEAIREELAAAQYVGARLLREEGRPSEVWRPVSNAARQHYRFLAGSEDESSAKITAKPASHHEAMSGNEASDNVADRKQQMQRNLEQVLNLEQTPSDQLQGIPLPRSSPQARRPGDGQPGDQPGTGLGRGPLRDGPPGNGGGIPQPWGGGW